MPVGHMMFTMSPITELQEKHVSFIEVMGDKELVRSSLSLNILCIIRTLLYSLKVFLTDQRHPSS